MLPQARERTRDAQRRIKAFIGRALKHFIMAKLELVKIDSKGRVVLPQAFRESLRLREGDKTFLALDEENERVIISPGGERNLTLMEIEMSDKPGTLARLATALAREGVDLVSTESHSLDRSRNAVWRVLANTTSVKDWEVLKRRLREAGAVSVKTHKL